jgi:hypothetical protein
MKRKAGKRKKKKRKEEDKSRVILLSLWKKQYFERKMKRENCLTFEKS